MSTASFQFVLFGLMAALVSNLCRSRIWRNLVLAASSMAFLFLLVQRPQALAPLVGFVGFGYFALLLLQRGASKAMAWSVLAVVLLYVWLKRYTFLPASILLHSPYFTLGLSYIFFRVLHLLIETGDAGVSKVGLGAYLLYTLNFTTLISGPIQRYEEFARDQFASEPLPLGPRVIGAQLERIIRGFFKVNVAAVLLLALNRDAFAELSPAYPMQLRFASALVVSIAYPFYLYANFSGYIDIVIAIARLMRLRLPENFDRPFSATSFIEFWNRWHITLSTWFKTYVYNPMLVSLMRRIVNPKLQPFLGVVCFFATFLLVGIWHGRTSEFVVYGVLQGAGVSINKLWQVWMAKTLGRNGYKSLTANLLYQAVSRGLTFSWFAFSLMWLWATWAQIGKLFGAMGILQWLSSWVVVWLASALFLTAWEWLLGVLVGIQFEQQPVLTNRYVRTVYASALGLASLIIVFALNQPAPQLVYKAF